MFPPEVDNEYIFWSPVVCVVRPVSAQESWPHRSGSCPPSSSYVPVQALSIVSKIFAFYWELRRLKKGKNSVNKEEGDSHTFRMIRINIWTSRRRSFTGLLTYEKFCPVEPKLGNWVLGTGHGLLGWKHEVDPVPFRRVWQFLSSWNFSERGRSAESL